MKVTFTRLHNIVKVDPLLPGMRDALSFTRKDYSIESRRMTSHKEHLCDENGMFPVGLLERAIDWCAGRGHQCDVRHEAALEWSLPDFTLIDALRDGQEDILSAIAAHDCGLIVAGTGAGKTFIACQICRMYPTMRIVVVSPRVPVIKTIYENLKPILGREVSLICGGSVPVKGARVEISTVASLMKTQLATCDLLLFDEAHGVGCNQTADMVAAAAVARRFGFTATPTGRSDGADLMIEALFGPVRAEIPYDEAVDKGLVVPIEVEMIEWDSSRTGTSDYVVPASKKRAGYWRNKYRNKLIAAAARLPPPDEQVLIMVETLEHAIYLHKELPEFQVVHFGKVEKGSVVAGLPMEQFALSRKETDELRRKFESGELKRALSTGVWKEGVSFNQLAVLIRADGSPSPILSQQIPGRLSRLSEGKSKGVLIDIFDKGDKWMEGRSHGRLNTYRKVGWTIRKLNLGTS